MWRWRWRPRSQSKTHFSHRFNFLSCEMGGSASSRTVWIWEIPRPNTLKKFSDEWKKIISNGTYICWKQEFFFSSQLSLTPISKLFYLFQSYLPVRPQSQSLKVPGGLQNTHCVSSTGMHCHCLSTSGPTPSVLARPEMTTAAKPQPGANLVFLCQQFHTSSVLSLMEHLVDTKHCAKCFSTLYDLIFWKSFLE